MKKSFISSGFSLFISVQLFCQVGINNTSPSSTLDIVASASTGTSTSIDGLLIPRMDRERVQSMINIPTSTLVYISDISTGSLSGTAVNISEVGYYYYNGSAWVKLYNPSNSSSLGQNIYNTDGSLSANRIMALGGKTLALTGGTTTSAFSVNGSVFSVDGANSRVGVNNASPTAALDVTGDIKSSGTVAATTAVTTANVTATGTVTADKVVATTSTSAAALTATSFTLTNGSQGSGKFLESDANGLASWVNSPLSPTVAGVLNTTTKTATANTCLGSSITLTYGSWIIYLGQLLVGASASTNAKNVWMRMTLGSNSSGTRSTDGFSFISSTLVSGYSSFANNSNYTFLSGVLLVDVTATAGVTLYTWFQNFDSLGTPPAQTYGDNGENYLFAIPIYN